MTTDAADVDQATQDALASLVMGDPSVLEDALELREIAQERSGLDARTFSLVKIAALIAVDAPPASYLWQVPNALDAGATPGEILGVLRAVAPQVGGPRVVGAVPEIMLALGLSLPDGASDRPGRLRGDGHVPTTSAHACRRNRRWRICRG